MTAGQLELIDGQEWKLEEPDRDAGRRGVRRAREALLDARRRLAARTDHQHHDGDASQRTAA